MRTERSSWEADPDAATELVAAAPADLADATTVFHADRGDATEVMAVVPAYLPDPIAYEARRNGSRGRRILTIAGMSLAAIAAVGAAILVGTRANEPTTTDSSGVTTHTPNSKYPPQRDASLERCTIDRAGVRAGGTVRNRSKDTADYVIDVVLIDGGGMQITNGTATVRDVPSGSEQNWEATMPPQSTTAPSASCKIVTVDRYRSAP